MPRTTTMSSRGSAKPSPSTSAGSIVVAAEQALLPQLAHAARRLAGMRAVGGDAAGLQQVGDGALEGLCIEAADARNAQAGG